MKKICASLAVASALFVANANAGMVIDVEGGTGLWYAETSGDFGYKGIGQIDLQNDLGLEDDSNGFYYIDVNHFVPIVPNVRIESQNFMSEGKTKNAVNFKTAGVGGQIAAGQKTALKLDQSDFIVYWGVPGLKTLSLGHVGVDFGLVAKKFDGYAQVGTETVNIDFTVPMGYLAASVKIPFINTKVSASTKMISYKSSSLSDSMIKASFKLPIPIPAIDVKAEVGYKTQNLDLDEDLSDDFNADIKNSGMFVGITAKF